MNHVFSCHVLISPVERVIYFSTTANRSSSLHHQQFFAIDLDGLAAVLAEQDAVALLDIHGDDVATVVALAGADRQDFALIGLFGGVVGNDDSRGGLGFLLHALHDHAIGQRTKVHGISLMGSNLLAIKGSGHSFANRESTTCAADVPVSTRRDRVLAERIIGSDDRVSSHFAKLCPLGWNRAAAAVL